MANILILYTYNNKIDGYEIWECKIRNNIIYMQIFLTYRFYPPDKKGFNKLSINKKEN